MQKNFLISSGIFNKMQFYRINYTSKKYANNIHKISNNTFQHNYTNVITFGHAIMIFFVSKPEAGTWYRNKKLWFNLDFLFKILIIWFLKVEQKQDFFKQIFNYQDKKLLIYESPQLEILKKTQQELMGKDIFLQFELKSTSRGQILWKVRNVVKVFPNIQKIIVFKHFYNNYQAISWSALNPISLWMHAIIPKIIIAWTGLNLLIEIKSNLNFNLFHITTLNNLIKIAPHQFDIDIGNIKSSRILFINWSYKLQTKKFYIGQSLIFYGSY